MPVYPAVSRRLEETGQTLHNVHVLPDGRPQKADLVRSSGFPRLDAAAQEALMRSRYEIRLDADKAPRGSPTGIVVIPVPFKFQLNDGEPPTTERNTNEPSLRHC